MITGAARRKLHHRHHCIDRDGMAAASLSQLETDGTSAVVAVAGQFDPAAQTLDADEIAILTDTELLRRRPGDLCQPFVGPGYRNEFLCAGGSAV